MLAISHLLVFSSLRAQDTLIMTEYPKFDRADSLLGFPFPERTCYDVHYYNLDIVPNTDDKTLKGAVDIHFTALEKFRTMQIDLYPELKIHSITFNGDLLEYEREHTAVFVHFPRKIKKGSNNYISVAYSGKPIEAADAPWDGGVVWQTDSTGHPWVGVTVQQEGGSLWWPCKDLISDKADSALIQITTAGYLNGVANGTLVDEVPLNDSVKYVWKVTYPIVNYNITFYIGRFAHFSIDYGEKYGSELEKLDFYVLHQDYHYARLHFLQTPDVVHFCEKMFGPYPFPRDGYKLVESPYEGMEHQTAIAYGSAFEEYWDGYDYIILHETAHEWWGNAVTATDFADIWLHEGFATYAEYLFYYENTSVSSALNYIVYDQGNINNVKPVIGPSGVRFWDCNDSDVYNKAGSFLQTLQNQFDNKEDFMQLMQRFFANYKYGNVTTTDFESHFKPQLSYLTPLIDTYLKTAEAPELLVDQIRTHIDSVTQFMRFRNVTDGFKLKINHDLYDGTTTRYLISDDYDMYMKYVPLDEYTLWYLDFYGSYYDVEVRDIAPWQVESINRGIKLRKMGPKETEGD
ncbi:MAG: M1 family metallopeptidase [Salinivirgaceae bacterium]